MEPTAERYATDGRRRILVVANETVGGEALREVVEAHARGYEAEALVVCPALASRLSYWLSDVDGARAKAARRLADSLAALAALGIQSEGRVGDPDPVQAIQDALRTFPADEIIVSTHPPGRSNWLEKRVVERARARFAVPITHVIVDLDCERTSAEPVAVGSRAAATDDG